jgi:DNA mismatch repair protein MutL
MAANDNRVRVLPVHVANKIAAGEVVERPAAVVKELVENSIDAGAKHITVTILCGGSKLISVKDDGIGMSKDDAVTCLERQATSKIYDVDDIENINTLGFRGEAIPSIASVSKFSITTRRDESDEGTFIQVDAGTLVTVEPKGCPKGTIIEVKDLFFNVPARKKFLRSVGTEESHIKSILIKLALSHSNISFTLNIGSHQVFNLAKTQHIEERIAEIFGEDFLDSMVRLSYQGHVCITGFIEKPAISSTSRHDQFIFVNSRASSAPAIQYAIKEAYPRKQGDAKPGAIIFITLPATDVDVNVHPTKREVKFRNDSKVKSALAAAIEEALSSLHAKNLDANCNTASCFGSSLPGQDLKLSDVTEQDVKNIETDFKAFSGISINKKSDRDLFDINKKPDAPMPEPVPVVQEFPMVAENETTATHWKWFNFLAITNSGYILIETDSGLVTINPYAAKERIAFERLSKQNVPSQQLLIPEIVRLSPVDFSRIKTSLEIMTQMGFQLEEFGNSTFKIEAVPQIADSLKVENILSTIARDLSESGGERIGRWKEERIAKSIAKSFSGTEMKLTEETAVKLIEELCSCKMPYICPRGKCIMIFTSTRELNRKFDRN